MSQLLPAELDTLVYRGLLLPSEEDDPHAFLRDLAECTARGEVTLGQAWALCHLLGLGAGDLEAETKRARAD
jgi:hypothetical protein